MDRDGLAYSRSFLCLPIAGLVLLGLVLGGCDTFLGYNGPGGGTRVTVDGAGHFLSSLTYTSGDYVEVYNADGSFQRSWFGYDSTLKANVQANGDKGTYSYDYDNMVLKLTLTRYYDSTSKAWLAYKSTAKFTYSGPKLFLEHSAPRVYARDTPIWKSVDTYTYVDSASAAQNRVDSYNRTLGLTAGMGGLTFEYQHTVKLGTAAIYTEYESVTYGDTTILGGSAQLDAGATVTFLSTVTSHTSQSWNSATKALDPLVQNSLGYHTDTVTNKDDTSLFYFPSDATRELVSPNTDWWGDTPPAPLPDPL